MNARSTRVFRKHALSLSSIASQLAPTRSTALRPTLATVTGFLTLAKEHLIAHYRFVRVLGLHMLDVVVVVGHADHQACSLTEVFTEATQVIEHAAILWLRIRQRLEWRFFIRTL